MPSLTHIFRHPIKAVGLESIDKASLEVGKTLAGDRLWAVMHDASKYDPSEGWGRCMNFMRGVSSNQLMAVRAKLSGDTISLSHPGIGGITVSPDNSDDAAILIAWISKISNPDRSAPTRVVRATKQGMTDNSNPYISILCEASRAALSEICGTDLAKERFRGNLWLDGTSPWEESTWVGKTLTLGEAVLEIVEPIERCKATTVDPFTGISDVDTLSMLEKTRNNRDFGMFAKVQTNGIVRVGDKVELS